MPALRHSISHGRINVRLLYPPGGCTAGPPDFEKFSSLVWEILTPECRSHHTPGHEDTRHQAYHTSGMTEQARGSRTTGTIPMGARDHHTPCTRTNSSHHTQGHHDTTHRHHTGSCRQQDYMHYPVGSIRPPRTMHLDEVTSDTRIPQSPHIRTPQSRRHTAKHRQYDHRHY